MQKTLFGQALILGLFTVILAAGAGCAGEESTPSKSDKDLGVPECVEDADCPLGRCCRSGACVPCSGGDPDHEVDPPDLFEGVCTSSSDCDDGNFCNGQEECVQGKCQAGTPPTCDDGIECTVDWCDPETNSCKHEPDDSLCSDGNACNGAEICDPTAGCIAGTPLDCDDGFDCTTDSCDPEQGCVHETNDSLCDDGIDCTEDRCEVGRGCVNEPRDTLCDDGVDCTQDTCDPSSGCDHRPIDSLCDDSLACTRDTCNPETGCSNTPDNRQCPEGKICRPDDPSHDEYGCVEPPDCNTDEDCDDGNYCNGTERCVDGTCTSGEPVRCDDGLSCTVDVCNEETDSCDFQPMDEFCDDGNPCNGAERCAPSDPNHDANGCVAGTPPNCDDGIDCTVDSCDPAHGCVHEPNHAVCDDGIPCTVDRCSEENRGCVHEPNDAACDDGIDCTLDFCNSQTGCVHRTDDSACNDGFACTDEYCDEQMGCVYTTHNERCDDGIDCTENACVRGRGCVYTPDDSMCPPNEICDPSQGCRVPPECETDDDCSDGNACNGIERCVDGFCRNGEPPNCDDGIDCTIDSCDPQTGCVNEPDNSACSDGDPCTADICNPSSGCENPVAKDSDNDGYIDANCPGGNDCDDNNDAVHPGQPEICSDGIDNNCDELTDDEDEITCGNCGGSCPDGLYCCHNQCVDLNTNNEHCGACDNACPSGTRCWDRQCRPADHPCFVAIDRLITSTYEEYFRYTGQSDDFNPRGSSSCDRDLDGPDLVWAFKKNPNEPITVYLYPPSGEDITDEYLYIVSDCFDMNSCIDYEKALNWNEITLPAGAPEHVYFAIADWGASYAPDNAQRMIKIAYNDEGGGCRNTGSFTASASAVLLVLLALRALRRRRRAER